MANQVVWFDMPVPELDRRKHPIGPYGFRVIVLDSEGNRIALHSM